MRRIGLFLPFMLLWVGIPGPSHAQDQSAQPGATGSEAANSSSQNNDNSAGKGTDKKVWTNDDLENLDDQTTTGTIKTGRANVPRNAAKNTQVKGRDAKWYRAEIAALEAKIPPLDEKIRNLKAALNGEPVTSAPHYEWSRQDDWHSQLARLEKQRGDIEDKISNLEDEARHDGVPANALP